MAVCKNRITNYWEDIDFKPVADSLVLWLTSDFDDVVTNTWVDRSGLGNIGTFVPFDPSLPATYVKRVSLHPSGIFGTEIFVQYGARCDIYNSASLNIANTSITVDVSVKTSDVSGAILERGGQGNGFAVYTNGTIRGAVRINDILYVVNSNVIPDNTRQYVTLVITNTKADIYINGVYKNGISLPSYITTEPSDYTVLGSVVGTYPGEIVGSLTGNISDVRQYNRELTSSEILYNYQHSTAYYLNNLIG